MQRLGLFSVSSQCILTSLFVDDGVEGFDGARRSAKGELAIETAVMTVFSASSRSALDDSVIEALLLDVRTAPQDGGNVLDVKEAKMPSMP